MTRCRPWFGVLLLAAVGALLPAPAAAQEADPPGNNGTVKIDDPASPDPEDTHDPSNEPHVPCVFEVELYGYDADQPTAFVTLDLHPPTGAPETIVDRDAVDLDDDDRTGAGTDNGFDGSAIYDLTAALAGREPHEQQGFHVRLTVEVPDSNGAEIKHKMFWVECETEVQGTIVTTPTTETPTSLTSNSTTAQVEGVQVSRAQVQGAQLARSGPPTFLVVLAAIGVASIAFGLTAERTARRRLARH